MDSAQKSTAPREPVNPESDRKPLEPISGTLANPAAGTNMRSQPVPARVVWMHRLSLVIFVVFCIELGMLLAILPWTLFWNQNSFVQGYPAVRSFLQQDFVRGVITGIGLIDIWIGIWEAVHYRDPGRRRADLQ